MPSQSPDGARRPSSARLRWRVLACSIQRDPWLLRPPLMLPARRSALSSALGALDESRGRGAKVRLRVGLLDGTVVDGILVSASADHLSLLLPSAQARYIPADQVRSVHQATRRPLRELAPVSLIILGTTAAVIPLARSDLLRSHLPTIVGSLVLLEFAFLVFLMKRTALGSWLTAWKTLFDGRGG